MTQDTSIAYSIIDSPDALESWLAAHHGFLESYVLRMEPRPQVNGAPLLPTVTLEIATQHDGGFAAGDQRAMRVYEIRAEGVETFWIENARGYDAAYCSDSGIHQLAINRPGIQMQVPARVQLACDTMTIRELGDRNEIIQPWIDELELSIQVRGYELPSPGDLVELFAQEGASVVWHRFGEGPRAASTVPLDYSGWYLQQPERFAKEGGEGLFIFAATTREGSFVLHMQNHDSSNRELWRAWQKILLHYPDIEIRTGNCRLTSAQWQQYLTDGYAL